MMSLFSSFDLGFFSYVFCSMVFSSFLLTSSSLYYLTGGSHLKVSTYKFFLGYFFSINHKEFKLVHLSLISLFFMIFFLNFFSVYSYNFPVTSQINVILGISICLWLASNLFSLSCNSKGWISHNIPQGCPLPLAWFLFLIEMVSNTIRPLTLSIRLVANILAGHLLLSLLSLLVLNFWPTLVFYFVLNFLEFFVSVIQAYIMVTMISLYYSEL